MKARQVLADAAFSPDTLKVLSRAFDDAWDQIAPGTGAETIEADRLKLANIILTLARTGNRDARHFTDAAVRVMLAIRP
jgi:hypothetical protein